jgi:DNA polymerase-1
MKLLIDGDALIFPILEACKDEAISDDGEVLWQQLQFKESLEQIDAKIDWFGHKDFLIAFSCPSPECFRRDLSPTYKANRSGIKPLGFTRTITSLRERYECLTWPRLEADDILGILQSQPDTETMIVGVDKDFLTVPGKVMHPGTRDVVSVSQEEADYNHLVQTLTGDSTDGYPGAKGVGPKAVEKLGYPLTWGQVPRRRGSRLGPGPPCSDPPLGGLGPREERAYSLESCDRFR